MASETYPAQSPTRQRVAAWIALALASIVPLTVAVNAFATLARIPGAGSDIVISSLYTVFFCFEWPLPIFATFLAGLVLRDSRGGSRIAWTAFLLGILTLLALLGVVVFLSFFAHGQSASSMVSMLRG
ncbi:MAG TPA: hypothetical protein VJO13_00785 [Ktedonobacterales bacterium]|nr:hypothetical protein [Ktedonobacterales bacterium]